MKQLLNFRSLLLAILLAGTLLTNAQDNAPGDGMSTPMSGNAMASSRFENTPVNYYTGIPSISIPIFNYSQQNGLNLNITLDYSAGGIRVFEGPSTAGLGWNVNAGGLVVRTIRGMPDDFPENGFLYSSGLPIDFRTNANKYYHDSLDAQQDVFQFNINGRSGKFFIGKNKQIVTVPLSKLQIGYTTASDNSTINSFYIINESGVKYLFNEVETGSTTHDNFKCGYDASKYNTAWYLSSIIAPFSTDTIKYYYRGNIQTREVSFGQQAFFSPFGNMVKYTNSTGSQTVLTKKLYSISFPDDKKVTFVYDPYYRYDVKDFALNSIHIRDSILRYGYHFQWGDSGRTFLTGLRAYTDSFIKPGYKFLYNSPYFPQFYSEGDTLINKRDHWGFYNAAAHDTNRIPTVAGIYTGANRNPSTAAIASSLSTIIDPSGGKTYYTFENNDVYRPFNLTPQYKRLNCKTNDEVEIRLNHVTNTKDSFTFSFNSFSEFGEGFPFTGTAKLICSVTNTDSTVTYATDSLSLYDLYNYGSVSLVFNNIPDGEKVFKAKLSTGTTVTSHNLFINLNWTTQDPVIVNKILVGGLRIKQIAHFDAVTGKTDTISTFKYELPNGRSSGFLGVIPSYHHSYLETILQGTSAVSEQMTVISSEPVNNLTYTQGSPVGYSRVEVIKGSLANNLGKQVFEYTSLQDLGMNVHADIFPYAPYMQRDWALGLNKKTSVYNNVGRLMQETVNTYNIINQQYQDSAFKSLKLGLISIFYNGVPGEEGTTLSEAFTGEYYYPESGRSELLNSIQTFYHIDNSIQSKINSIEYDSNYNAVKMISNYDQNRGLLLERRLYFPYHYTLGGALGILRNNNIYSVVSSEDWITGDNNPRMIAASVTEFHQIAGGQIKPAKVYALQTKAPVPLSTIGVFDPSTLIRNTSLLKPQQEFVNYDLDGNCLEVKNPVSGLSNAVIMDYHNRLPVAQVSNARLSDVAYSSFESDGTGNWTIPSTDRTDSVSITGKKSYNLSSGSITKSGLDNNMIYILSYWKKNSASVTVSGAINPLEIADQNGWKLMTQTITSATSITVSGTGLIDELRLYPKDANMATSTYEPSIGVTSSCDANNTIIYYQYDSANRLKVIRDKDFNIIKMHEYSDSLIKRSINNPYKAYMGGSEVNPINGSFIWRCYYYWRYNDAIMGEENLETETNNCPKNMEALPIFPMD